MEENKFWLSLWSVVAATVFSLGGLTLISSMDTTRALTAMVSSGADPMRAACALKIQPADGGMCAIQATK